MWRCVTSVPEQMADARTCSGGLVLKKLEIVCFGWHGDALKAWCRPLPWFGFPQQQVSENLEQAFFFSFVEDTERNFGQSLADER